MKNKSFIFILFFYSTLSSFSQTLSDAEISSIIKNYGSKQREDLDLKQFQSNHTSSVNGYNGTFNFSVPLVNASVGSINVDISASYTSGIKVTDRSGVLGMGWNLSSIGSITRQVNGISDFGEGNYLSGSSVILAKGILDQGGYPNLPVSLYNTGVVNYSCPELLFESDLNPELPFDDITFSSDDYFGAVKLDTERDVFTLNVPGKSIKFFFLNTSEVKVIGNEKIKILERPTTDNVEFPENCGWCVILDNGFKYYFGYTENDILVSLNCGNGNACNQNVNAWQLNKIEAPSGEWIEIEYLKQNLLSFNPSPSYNCTEDLHSGSVILSSETQFNTYVPSASINYQDASILKEVRLYKSEYLQEKLVFEYTNNRTDRDNALELSEIQHKKINYQNTFPQESTIKSIWLNYLITPFRTWLKSITQKSSTSQSLPPYSFDYSSPEEIPHRFSSAVDYFGYYNGEVNNNKLVPCNDLSGSNYSPFIANSIGCSNRSPNNSCITKGNLTRITTPLAAEILIDYEPNVIANYFYSSGIRVQKIRVIDEDAGIDKVSRYVYTSNIFNTDSTELFLNYSSSGLLMRLPNFHKQASSVKFITSGFSNNLLLSSSVILNASPVNGYSFSAQGKEVAYDKVYTLHGENGEYGVSETTYVNNVDNPLNSHCSTSGVMTNSNSQNIVPIHSIPTSSAENINGAVLSIKELYKNNSGFWKVKTKKTNSYQESFVYQTGSILTSLSSSVTPGLGCATSGAIADFSNCIYYECKHTFHELTSSTTTFYDEDYTALNVAETFNYLNGKISSIRLYHNDIIQSSKLFSYYPYSSFPGEMVSWQISDSPLMLLSKVELKNKDNEIVDGQKFYYNEFNQLTKTFQFNNSIQGNDPFELIEQRSYSSDHHPSNTISRTKPVQGLVFENNQPVFTVTGAKVEQCLLNDFEDSFNGFNNVLEKTEDCFSGVYAAAVEIGTNSLIAKLNEPLRNSQYSLSFWSNNVQAFDISIYISEDNALIPLLNLFSGNVPVLSWDLHELSFSVPDIDLSNKSLVVTFTSSTPQSIKIDNFKLYPSLAKIESSHFDRRGFLISKIDVNNRIERYEYDDLDRLKIVRDFEKNIIKHEEIKLKNN